MKIPTIIGIILVIVFVGGIVFISERAFRGPTVASISMQPKTVQLTNISDTSFTVSWVTQSPTTGVLEISSSLTNKQVSYDERDSTGKLGKYTTHSVTARSLKPNTQYTIRILSNGKPYTDAAVSRIQTPAPLTAALGGLEPAYGMIRTSDGLPADGAIVFITLEGGQMLSTITKPSGSWLIPLSLSRTADLSAFLPTVERMTEQILVRWGDEETTAITDSLNDSPTPEMTMGKTYDFRKLQAKTIDGGQLALRTSPTPQAVKNTGGTGGAVLGSETVVSKEVTLTNPTEGSALSTNLPLVSGTGVPNAIVSISLGITNPISGSTKISSDGTWNFTPPKRLGAGRQSVTISSVNAKGKPVAITHMFEVLKSGTQVLGDATPSATLTPEITETITGTPAAETPTSTLAGEPVPTSGSILPTILLILVSLSLFTGGVVVFAR